MKPSIPKGTRDFSPQEMMRRQYIFDTIKKVFRTYGYAPLETPAMENLSTLLGKYGEEGDKLLFKILNSGDYLEALDAKTRGLNDKELKQLVELSDISLCESIDYVKAGIDLKKEVKKIEKEYNNHFSNTEKNLGKFIFLLSNGKKRKKETLRTLTCNKLRSYIKSAIRQSKLKNLTVNSLTPRVSEKGLRYDLTVPFARYVVQHRNELVFPFRRYQIQPVWRADRPQKGRYREFYQCDVDVIGTGSLLCEVELIEIVERVFRALGIGAVLKMNNRKILFGIAQTIGHADKMTDITVAIDKLDKIGLESVKAELSERGLEKEAVERLQPILQLTGDNKHKISKLKTILSASETGLKGVEEMETVFNHIEALGIDLEVELDLSLARGLNYYTGAIFEVKARDFAIGSICGGGRYDDLTGIFGMPDMSGVGISFGADRIYDVMAGLNLFPEELSSTTQVLFTNLGEAEQAVSLRLLKSLREAGIAAEIYPEQGKIKKQMEYANRRAIPFVIIIGSQELETKTATIKDMRSGEQREVAFVEIQNSKFKIQN